MNFSRWSRTQNLQSESSFANIVFINIDWKKGTETQEIASETIYTRNINQETDDVEETGEPVIAVHLDKQPKVREHLIHALLVCCWIRHKHCIFLL